MLMFARWRTYLTIKSQQHNQGNRTTTINISLSRIPNIYIFVYIPQLMTIVAYSRILVLHHKIYFKDIDRAELAQ